MAEEEDSEKRFQKIMDKLFHAPKRFSSSSARAQSGAKGVKSIPASRPQLSSRRDVVEENGFRRSLVLVGSQAPLCRPWDRGDLMRRMAMFKSMTWFGKPKAVSPINCARRGWVNVEMDIIACEACGARLLFSTPPSWSQQQVEKAAAVFSLKLDSGHKLLCPWINNACDETLALFPPTPAPTLVEGYRERSYALLQLSALPVILSSAIDYMRNPQLENFLARSSHPHALNDVIQPSGSSRSKELVNEAESISANLYYQALKMISLCGWEPQILPYAVDCEDRSTKSAEDAYSSEIFPEFVSKQNSSMVVYSSTASDEVASVKDSPTPGELQYDPASVVLNCKLCGASVGLWAFSTVPRPLEFFRITESTEVNGQNNSATSGTNVASRGHLDIYHLRKENLDHNQSIASTSYNGSVVSRERPLSLNLSIAGGPSPTKQKFRATVSLPIISRHFRTAFSSISDFRNSESSNMLGVSQENVQPDLQGNNSLRGEKDDHTDGTGSMQDTRSEDVETLKRKRNDDEFCASRGSNFDAQSFPNVEVNEVENASRNEESGDMCCDGEPSNEQELPLENPSQCMPNMAKNLGRKDTLPEDIENAAVCAGSGAVTGSQVQECLNTTLEFNGTIEYVKSGETNSLMPSVDPCNQHGEDISRENPMKSAASPRDSHRASTSVTSCLEANATVSSTHNIESRKGDKGSHLQSPPGAEIHNQNVKRVKEAVQSSDSNGNFGACKSGSDLRLMRWDKKMEFDPIWQHRHFCPWIASAGGASMPGWKLTLSALDHAEKPSLAPPLESPTTQSIYKVDDPITSVRKLFMSPSEKRLRSARGSN